MKKLKKYPFTLVELLAVIGILSLLFGIFVPAFSRMMFGSKVDSSASAFRTGLEVAQSRAVASRKYVAMILPTNYDNITDNKLKPYCGGGYRLAFVTSENNFAGWVPGTTWMNPSDGAGLTAVQSRKDWYETVGDSSSGWKALPGPEDELDKACTGASVLTEIGKGDVADGDFEAIGTDSAKDNWRGIVFSPFGGVIGNTTPLLFFFTERKIDGSSYEYPNTDNFLVLKLNPLTGRVVYIAPED